MRDLGNRIARIWGRIGGNAADVREEGFVFRDERFQNSVTCPLTTPRQTAI